MKIIVECHKCKKPLPAKDSFLNAIGDLVLRVELCDDLNCRDCSKCEVEAENEKLKKEVVDLKQKMQKL